MSRETSEWETRKDQSTDAGHRGGAARSRGEGPVMGLDRRGCGILLRQRPTGDGRSRVTTAKPFDIPKREVWEAFKKVKANQGAAGVDGQTIEEFEVGLAGNLYKLWNRLSSGSYFPPPVRRVDIPKASGGTRPLGIPTVADRVAQEVVRRYLEPCLEPVFHADSYGYRPGRSAVDAVRTGAPAVLAVRLGARHRHQGVFRQHPTICCSRRSGNTRIALGCCSMWNAG